MSFPNGSFFLADDDHDDNPIKQKYTLTEMTLPDLKLWNDAADPPPAVYNEEFKSEPDNTIFVRFPREGNLSGGYLSVLAKDLDSVATSAGEIAITFFKGEKFIHDEARDKTNAERAQFEFAEKIEPERKQLLDNIERLEKMNDVIGYRMIDPRTLERRELINWCNMEKDAPELFKDNVFTESVMEFPVIAEDGYTYERDEILKWLKKSDKSPTTGAFLKNTNLTENNTLRSQINQWMEFKVKQHANDKLSLNALRLDFFNNTHELASIRARLKELETEKKGIFQKYETPTPELYNHWSYFDAPPMSKARFKKIRDGLFHKDDVVFKEDVKVRKGGKSSRTRPTRKTRKRNVRGRRVSRRDIHRSNAKK
jgi:hypothetical protein